MSADGPSPDELLRRLQATTTLVALVLTVVLAPVVFFPVVQSAAYGLVVGTPSFLQWTAIAVVVTVGLGTLYRSGTRWIGGGPNSALPGVELDPWRIGMTGLGIVFVMGMVVGPAAGDVYAKEHVADEMASNAQVVDDLPPSSADHVRILPRQVADQYADSSIQFPQFGSGSSDIAYRDGRYTWSIPLVPDNPWIALTGNQHGAVYVDMETADKQVAVRETEFQVGLGQLLFDSFDYQATLNRPLVDHRPATRFVFERDGEAYLAQSYVRHEWHVRLFPLPQVYSVPRFGGVQVVDQDGNFETIPADEVADSELLAGQNVYPYELVRFRTLATNFEQGVVNRYLSKEGVLDLATLPADGNDWPVSVPTGTADEPELTYFVATEATGSGSGVFEVWTFDSQTGAASVKSYDDAQIGPQKATEFVRQNQEVARLNDVSVVEPVPLVRDGRLFWQVRVVPDGSNGVTFTGFVNATSGRTIIVSETDAVRAFVAGDRVTLDDRPGDDRLGDDRPTEGGTTVTVIVTDGDGDVVSRSNVTVPENGSVSVTVEDDSGPNGTANETSG